MNFQASFPQTDLKASLLSTSLLSQVPNAYSLGGSNYSSSLLKNQQLQLLSNQLAELQQQSFIRSQISLPQVSLPQAMMKPSQPLLNPVELINPLITSSPLLDSNLITQINRAKLINQQRMREEAKISAQNQAIMLSGLLEKYSTLRQTEVAAQTQAIETAKRVSEMAAPTFPQRGYNPVIKFTQKRARRKAAEIQRSHKCPFKGCDKSYGSEASMIQHYRLKHPGASQEDQNALNQNVNSNEVQATQSTNNDGVEAAITSTSTPLN